MTTPIFPSLQQRISRIHYGSTLRDIRRCVALVEKSGAQLYGQTGGERRGVFLELREGGHYLPALFSPSAQRLALEWAFSCKGESQLITKLFYETYYVSENGKRIVDISPNHTKSFVQYQFTTIPQSRNHYGIVEMGMGGIVPPTWQNLTANQTEISPVLWVEALYQGRLGEIIKKAEDASGSAYLRSFYVSDKAKEIFRTSDTTAYYPMSVLSSALDRAISEMGANFSLNLALSACRPQTERPKGEERKKEKSEVADVSDSPSDGEKHGGDGNSGEVDAQAETSSDQPREGKNESDSSAPQENGMGEASGGSSGQHAQSGAASPSAQGQTSNDGLATATSASEHAEAEPSTLCPQSSPQRNGETSTPLVRSATSGDSSQDSRERDTTEKKTRQEDRADCAEGSDSLRAATPTTDLRKQPQERESGMGNMEHPNEGKPENSDGSESEEVEAQATDSADSKPSRKRPRKRESAVVTDAAEQSRSAAMAAKQRDDNESPLGRIEPSFGGDYSLSKSFYPQRVSPKDVSDVENALARMFRAINQISTQAETPSPRIHATKLVKQIVSRNIHLSRARREELTRSYVLIMCDVSGSCSAVCGATLAACEGISKKTERVLLCVHSNGYPTYLVDDRGEVLNTAGQTPQEWWGKLFEKYPIAGTVHFGDWDAGWILELLAVKAPLVWLDSDLCGQLNDATPARAVLREHAKGWKKQPAAWWMGVNSASRAAKALKESVPLVRRWR